MTYNSRCPRCGKTIQGEDNESWKEEISKHKCSNWMIDDPSPISSLGTLERAGLAIHGITKEDLKDFERENMPVPRPLPIAGDSPLHQVFEVRGIKPCWKEFLRDGETQINDDVVEAWRDEAVQAGAANEAILDYEEKVYSGYSLEFSNAMIERARNRQSGATPCDLLQRKFPLFFLGHCKGCPRDPRMYTNPMMVLDYGSHLEVWFDTRRVFRETKQNVIKFNHWQKWLVDHTNEMLQATKENRELHAIMVRTWLSRAKFVDTGEIDDDQFMLDQFLDGIRQSEISTDRWILEVREHNTAWHDPEGDRFTVTGHTVRELTPPGLSPKKLNILLRERGLIAEKVQHTRIGNRPMALWHLIFSKIWPKGGPLPKITGLRASAERIFAQLTSNNQELEVDITALTDTDSFRVRTVMVENKVWVAAHTLKKKAQKEGIALEALIDQFRLMNVTAGPEKVITAGRMNLSVVQFDLAHWDHRPGEVPGGGDDEGAWKDRKALKIPGDVLGEIEATPKALAGQRVKQAVRELAGAEGIRTEDLVKHFAGKMEAAAVAEGLDHLHADGKLYSPRKDSWRLL